MDQARLCDDIANQSRLPGTHRYHIGEDVLAPHYKRKVIEEASAAYEFMFKTNTYFPHRIIKYHQKHLKKNSKGT